MKPTIQRTVVLRSVFSSPKPMRKNKLKLKAYNFSFKTRKPPLSSSSLGKDQVCLRSDLSYPVITYLTYQVA